MRENPGISGGVWLATPWVRLDGGGGGWVASAAHPLFCVNGPLDSLRCMEIKDWWPRLPEGVRDELRANPDAPLSADAIIALTAARGAGPAGAAFEGRPMEYHLLDEEAEWIEKHGATFG